MNGAVYADDGNLRMEDVRSVNARFYVPLVAKCMLMNTRVLSREEGHPIICVKYVDSSTTPLSRARGVNKCIFVRNVELYKLRTSHTRVQPWHPALRAHHQQAMVSFHPNLKSDINSYGLKE